MYDIPNKIPPSFEKRKEPVEDIKYTPENIWDNIKISNIIRRYCRPVDNGSAAFCVLCR